MRYFMILFCTTCLLLSCTNDNTTLNVSCKQLQFDYEGGEQTFTIESDGDWSIYGLPDWLISSKLSGIKTQEIKLTASRNTMGIDRKQTLSIKTNDTKNIRTLTVIQYANSVGQVFSVDDTTLKYFNGTTSEREDSIVLSSSVRWRITGPSWLAMNFNGDISSMNGEIRSGSGTIYLRCCATNSETEAHKDTITIQSEYGDEIIKIPVEQLGIYDIKCTNMHILSDGIWWNYKYGRYTQYIMAGIYEGIVNPEEVENRQWKNPKNIFSISSKSNLKPNSYYTIFSRGMPTENTVYMQKVNVEVIRTATEENQPRAILENVELRDDGKWHFNVVMNENAKGFYVAGFKNSTGGKIVYAYNLYKYIDSNSIPIYYNNGNGTLANSVEVIATWAIDENGNLSNVVDTYEVNATNSAYAPVWQKESSCDYMEVMKSIDFNVEQPEITTIIK